MKFVFIPIIDFLRICPLLKTEIRNIFFRLKKIKYRLNHRGYFFTSKGADFRFCRQKQHEHRCIVNKQE